MTPPITGAASASFVVSSSSSLSKSAVPTTSPTKAKTTTTTTKLMTKTSTLSFSTKTPPRRNGPTKMTTMELSPSEPVPSSPFDTFRTMLHTNGQQQQEEVVESVENIENNNCNKISTTTTSYQSRRIVVFLSLLRWIVLDIPLLIVVLLFGISKFVSLTYETYYVPMFTRVVRTDQHLQEEYTYYNRICTEADLTTSNITDMIVQTTTSSETSIVNVDTAVQQMLLHGGVILRDLLPIDIVTQLRKYIQQKNAAIPDNEKYPVSQGRNRISYGIDASEHPIVSKAIQTIANNPTFRTLLQTILGDNDPASAEITAITSFYGAPPQVWHMDTKIDGNAVKYARTYSHSYSLFLPLQNTTEAMGITDVCPGSHMCSNDVLDLCERTKVGLHLVNDDNHFRAGDAAMLNQHIWHRGGEHTARDAEERIVFILSFLARPKFGYDPRQLSRGTYFHQKWNMWGHTVQDLINNPAITMTLQRSIVRCLGLFKLPTQNWGYDLLTATYMRFMNEQLEDGDFEERFLPRLDQIHFPTWLRGRTDYLFADDRYDQIIPQSKIWTSFITETITNINTFMQQVTRITHIVWITGSIILSFVISRIDTATSTRTGFIGTVRRSVVRLIIVYVVLFGIGYKVWDIIKQSSWGSSIRNGMAIRRSFPPGRVATQYDNEMIFGTKTTFPTRNDVLLGSRYDAPYLGSYNQWLQQHPGNRQYYHLLQQRHDEYVGLLPYVTNPNYNIFHKHLTHEIVTDLTTIYDGRFVQQDYRNGVWRVVSNKHIISTVIAEDIMALQYDDLTILRNQINQMIAHWRFDHLLRSTTMSTYTQYNLFKLKQTLFRLEQNNDNDKRGNDLVTTVITKNSTQTRTNARFRKKSSTVRDTIAQKKSTRKMSSWMFRSSKYRVLQSLSLTGSDNELHVGSLVWVWYPNFRLWFSGVILRMQDHKNNTNRVVVAFEDGSFDTVSKTLVRQQYPIVEGDTVYGCYVDDEDDDDDDDDPSPWKECYKGQILHILPSGTIAIQYFETNDIDWNVKRHRYFVPPYKYGIPLMDME